MGCEWNERIGSTGLQFNGRNGQLVRMPVAEKPVQSSGRGNYLTDGRGLVCGMCESAEPTKIYASCGNGGDEPSRVGTGLKVRRHQAIQTPTKTVIRQEEPITLP